MSFVSESSSSNSPPPLERWNGGAAHAKHVWKRSWVGLGVLLVVLAGWLGLRAVRAVLHGRAEANILIAELHDEMKSRQWDGIYESAAWNYRSSISPEDSRKLFEAIDRKLGTPAESIQEGTNVNVTGSGSYLTASFNTSFSGGTSATETLVWRSYGGDYRLVSYSIGSLALVTK